MGSQDAGGVVIDRQFFYYLPYVLWKNSKF